MTEDGQECLAGAESVSRRSWPNLRMTTRTTKPIRINIMHHRLFRKCAIHLIQQLAVFHRSRKWKRSLHGKQASAIVCAKVLRANFRFRTKKYVYWRPTPRSVPRRPDKPMREYRKRLRTSICSLRMSQKWKRGCPHRGARTHTIFWSSWAYWSIMARFVRWLGRSSQLTSQISTCWICSNASWSCVQQSSFALRHTRHYYRCTEQTLRFQSFALPKGLRLSAMNKL